MNATQLITEFGAYYLGNQGKQNADRLIQQLNVPAKTMEAFTSILSDDTIYQASETRIDKLLQPFQKGWTPKGTVEFLPIKIEQFKMKMDFEDTPDDLEATWAGFLTGKGIKREEWFFIRWLLEAHLIPQLQQDFELDAVYKGRRVNPTAGTPGAAHESMDGMGAVIERHIADGRTTPITLGAIETNPVHFVEQVQDLAKQVDDRYKGTPMQLNMDRTLAERYEEGFDEKYNVNYRQDTNSFKVKYNANLVVVGRDSMINSERMWATPKKNAILLKKRTQNMGMFEIQSVDRLVKIFTDFSMGVGVLIPEILFCNELQ